jgi:hypothetical protein
VSPAFTVWVITPTSTIVGVGWAVGVAVGVSVGVGV